LLDDTKPVIASTEEDKGISWTIPKDTLEASAFYTLTVTVSNPTIPGIEDVTEVINFDTKS